MFTQSSDEIMDKTVWKNERLLILQTILNSLNPTIRYEAYSSSDPTRNRLAWFQALSAQYTLDALQENARQNYPQIKQFDLIAKSADYNLVECRKRRICRKSRLSGRATSAVGCQST